MNPSTSTKMALAAMMSMLALVLVSSAGQDSTSVAMSLSLSTISGSLTSPYTVLGVITSPHVYLVQVGARGFHFAQLDNVSVGDVFYPPDHSVARAEYGEEPYIPYDYTSKDKIGFWSWTQ
jgi:hypothetical protein